MWPLGAVCVALAYSCILAAPAKDLFKVTVVEGESDDYEYESDPAAEETIIGDNRINPRNALPYSRFKWPNGRVPYIISSRHDFYTKKTIKAAMREIEQDVNGAAGVCVIFVPRTNERNYIEIKKGRGCGADVGMLGKGKQDVIIGNLCDTKGIIMHELIHVLGFRHEHSRYDRDSYININMSNVRDNERGNFNMARAGLLDTFNTSYDYSSIMHYEPYDGAKNVTVPVITPKSGLANGIKLGQRLALSNLDVIKIQRLYRCSEDTSHIRRAYITDNLVSCDFANDICTFINDTTANFYWAVRQGASGAGPLAGNTNGADAYLVATQLGRYRTARILTPSFQVGTVCVRFYRFQKGPSSYLKVMALGPLIGRKLLVTFRARHTNGWYPGSFQYDPPVGVVFQIAFEARIKLGDVALDDFNIYKGEC